MDPLNKIMLFVWAGLVVVFLVGEMVTAGFILLWFGIGSAVAGVLALLNLPLWLQIAAFIVVSSVLFALSRTIFKRMTRKVERSDIAADRTLGKTGVVIERIDPLTSKGMVRVINEEWRAESYDGTPIEPGAKVEVLKVEGVHLVVKPKEE